MQKGGGAMLQKVLMLVSVGSPPPALVRELEEPLGSQLGLSVVAGRSALQRPDYAFNKDRQQYHCNAILRRLTALLEPGQHFVLGLTDVDLFVPDSPFVFGEADRESRAGVVSVARLRQGVEPEVLRRRTQLEAVHQAGHLMGLSYCEDPRCVMYFSQAPHDYDKKQLTLCNLCRNEWQKLTR
jgi:archaemetzincin